MGQALLDAYILKEDGQIIEGLLPESILFKPSDSKTTMEVPLSQFQEKVFFCRAQAETARKKRPTPIQRKRELLKHRTPLPDQMKPDLTLPTILLGLEPPRALMQKYKDHVAQVEYLYKSISELTDETLLMEKVKEWNEALPEYTKTAQKYVQGISDFVKTNMKNPLANKTEYLQYLNGASNLVESRNEILHSGLIPEKALPIFIHRSFLAGLIPTFNSFLNRFGLTLESVYASDRTIGYKACFAPSGIAFIIPHALLAMRLSGLFYQKSLPHFSATKLLLDRDLPGYRCCVHPQDGITFIHRVLKNTDYTIKGKDEKKLIFQKKGEEKAYKVRSSRFFSYFYESFVSGEQIPPEEVDQFIRSQQRNCPSA